jgi:hypothetical protein
MQTLIVIRLRFGWADREAVDNASFDDRVQFALGLSRILEILGDHSTVCQYRARFLSRAMGRQILRHTLQTAAEMGFLGDDEDRADLFPIAGAAARQGTHVLYWRRSRRLGSTCQDCCARTTARGKSRRSPGVRRPSAMLQELVLDGRGWSMPLLAQTCPRACARRPICWASWLSRTSRRMRRGAS